MEKPKSDNGKTFNIRGEKEKRTKGLEKKFVICLCHLSLSLSHEGDKTKLFAVFCYRKK